MMEPLNTTTDSQDSSTEEDYGLGEVWQSIESFNQEVEQFFEDLIRMFLLMGAGFVLLIGLSYVLFSWIGSPRFQSKAAKKKFWLTNGYVLLGFLILAVLVYAIPAAMLYQQLSYSKCKNWRSNVYSRQFGYSSKDYPAFFVLSVSIYALLSSYAPHYGP